MTTFARIGKILNGEIQPKNWIERLFATFANSATHNELPAVSSSDNGKVLMVQEGDWGTGSIPNELPSVDASDNGKGLVVDNGAWGTGDLPEGVPPYTLSDENKVLTVEKVEDGADTTTIIQNQNVTFSFSEYIRGQLANDTWDFTSLNNGNTVVVNVGEHAYTCTYNSTANRLESKKLTVEYNGIVLWEDLSVATEGTFAVSAIRSVTHYKAQAGWKAASGSNDNGVLEANIVNGALTLNKTYSEIKNGHYTSVKVNADGNIQMFYISSVEQASTDLFTVDAVYPSAGQAISWSSVSFDTNSIDGYPAIIVGGN